MRRSGNADSMAESISARGLARVAQHRGDFDGAATTFMDSIVRSVRLPDAYVWTKAHALNAQPTTPGERLTCARTTSRQV